MKKFIMAVCVATVLTACGGESTSSETDVKTDSSTMTTTTDSSSMMNTAPAATDTSSAAISDTSHMKSDSSAK